MSMKSDKINISYLLAACPVAGLFFVKEMMLMRMESAVVWFFLLIVLPIIGIMVKSFHFKLIISILLFLFWAYTLLALIVGNYAIGLLDDRLFYILPFFIPPLCVSIYIYTLFKRDILEV